MLLKLTRRTDPDRTKFWKPRRDMIDNMVDYSEGGVSVVRVRPSNKSMKGRTNKTTLLPTFSGSKAALTFLQVSLSASIGHVVNGHLGWKQEGESGEHQKADDERGKVEFVLSVAARFAIAAGGRLSVSRAASGAAAAAIRL